MRSLQCKQAVSLSILEGNPSNSIKGFRQREAAVRRKLLLRVAPEARSERKVTNSVCVLNVQPTNKLE